MWKILAYFLVALLSVTLAMNSTEFAAMNTLPDGEIELLIKFHGITAKETTVSSRSKNKITLRQVTDGEHFIQLIYDGEDGLRDCEYVHINGQVEKFLQKFQDSLFTASNVTNHVPPSVVKWLHYTKLRKMCKKMHLEMKKAFKKNKNGFGVKARTKRDIDEMLRIPGTKWCGKGSSATKYTHLGGYSGTDRCCRKHDLACPFWIGAFDTKYGLFNWRMNTLMHCSCDDRFRACLKMADTSDANLVGKLFFNVVQTKCFVLKPKKVCTKRSWWGKCTKKKFIKQAMLRDNMYY